jgi:hypothetical protein
MPRVSLTLSFSCHIASYQGCRLFVVGAAVLLHTLLATPSHTFESGNLPEKFRR